MLSVFSQNVVVGAMSLVVLAVQVRSTTVWFPVPLVPEINFAPDRPLFG